MPELELARILRPEVRALRAYSTPAGDYAVRLDANEAPASLSAAARARLAEVASATRWERYPDPKLTELRAAIARHLDVEPDAVLVGVGSDEIITLLLTVLSKPQARASATTALTTTPTFVMYRMSAKLRGWQVVEVPLDAAWGLPEAGLLRALELAEPNLVFIASPNNPTGRLAELDRLERVIEAAGRALVVIDEAYVDYAARDQRELLRRHGNVAILRTLSKIGFAALRLGWLVAAPELVAELDKARLPYNVGSAAQALGRVVLTELWPEVRAGVAALVEERERVSAELGRFDGIDVTPSDANFLWFRSEQSAGELFERLRARGVLVRSFHERGGRLGSQLRATIGTRAENDAFLDTLREVL